MWLSKWKKNFPPGKGEVCVKIRKWIKDDSTQISNKDFRKSTNFETSLPRNLFPSEKTGVIIHTRAPNIPGKYTIHMELLHRYLAYFSDYNNKDLKIQVEVLALSPKKNIKLCIK